MQVASARVSPSQRNPSEQSASLLQRLPRPPVPSRMQRPLSVSKSRGKQRNGIGPDEDGSSSHPSSSSHGRQNPSPVQKPAGSTLSSPAVIVPQYSVASQSPMPSSSSTASQIL